MRATLPLLLALLVCVAVVNAIPPGTSVGTCVALADGDNFIEAFTGTSVYYAGLDEFGFRGAANFGRFTLTLAQDAIPDTLIYIHKYDGSAGTTSTYATQPSLSFPFGDAGTEIAMSDYGIGMSVGGSDIIFIKYDGGSETFGSPAFPASASLGVPGGVLGRVYIGGLLGLVYDFNISAFMLMVADATATGEWFHSGSQPTIPGFSDVAAFSRSRGEVAVLGSATTIDFYHVPGGASPFTYMYSITPPYSVADVSDIEYDYEDNLLVGEASLASVIYTHERDGTGLFLNAPTFTTTSDGSSLGFRIASNPMGASLGFVLATAPDNVPIVGDLGNLFLYDHLAGSYTLSSSYLTQFSGTSAHSNAVGHSPADPYLLYANDPVFQVGGTVDDPDGELVVFCGEAEDCGGSCGGFCDLDDNACTIDIINPTTFVCEFSAAVSPNDGNPCTFDLCVPAFGVTREVVGGTCTAIINGVGCPGTCDLGGCLPDDSLCGFPASPSPTPTISVTPSTTPSSGITASPTISASATVSDSSTVSASATSSETATTTPTPSNTASTTATPSNSPSTTPTPTQTTSTSPTMTPTPSSSAGCGFCPMIDGGTCRTLVSCTPSTCTYESNDNACVGTIFIPSYLTACHDLICDPGNSALASGCVAQPRSLGAPCDDDRPCTRNEQCGADFTCVGFPDHELCDDSDNDQCSRNQCYIEPLPLIDLDNQGCRLVAEAGPCLPDDPCIVHTEEFPTACDAETFLCVGGAQVECLDGASCILGTCVEDECLGDDDNCYERGGGDDDDDDDDGFSGGSIISFIVVLILGAVAVCCCLIWALLANREAREEREEEEQDELDYGGSNNVFLLPSSMR